MFCVVTHREPASHRPTDPFTELLWPTDPCDLTDRTCHPTSRLTSPAVPQFHGRRGARARPPAVEDRTRGADAEVLAILDVDPRRLAALPPFRRWAFQVTEPWCKEGALAAWEWWAWCSKSRGTELSGHVQECSFKKKQSRAEWEDLKMKTWK